MSNLVLLEGIYILVAVFAVGVTAIESMGLLGDHGDDDGGADSGDDGATGDFASGDDNSGDTGSDDGGDATNDAHGEDGVVTRGNLPKRRRPGSERYIFKILSTLRLTVYFGLGFGPMGLVATLLDTGALWSLVLAIVAGTVSAVLYRSFIRWQRKDLDSTVHERDLVGHQATVLIAIYPNETGRVRVQLAQMVCERYATSDSNDFIPKGARVDVLATSSDGLVVAMPHEHA